MTSVSEKRILVLDMDECLLHTVSESGGLLPHEENSDRVIITPHSLSNKRLSKSDNYIAYLRPGLRRFLSICDDYFQDVVIWSAGSDEYVESLIHKLYEGRKKPSIVWARSECEKTSDGTFYKPIHKLAEYIEGSNFNNMMIIDDNPGNFIQNLDNGIQIPPYSPDRTESGLNMEDTWLKEMCRWFVRKDVFYSDRLNECDKPKIYE